MKKISPRIISLFFALVSFPSISAQTVDIEIRGIQNAREATNAEINVNLIDKEEMDGSERYKRLVTNAVDKGLRVFGYYDSSVTFRLKKRQGERDLLIANVKLGKPTRIAGVDVKIEGEAAQDKDFIALHRDLPKEGDLVEHQQYDNYKNTLSTLALTKGYFGGKFIVSRLEISPETYQVWWRIIFNSGIRYRYGNIKFSHAQIRQDYLKNMLEIHSGEFYWVNELSTANNDFSSTGWFNSVLVQPTVNDKEKVVDLDFLLYPRKKNAIELGAGFATDAGPHLQIGWVKPWVNDRGHSFRTNMYVSSPKKNTRSYLQDTITAKSIKLLL